MTSLYTSVWRFITEIHYNGFIILYFKTNQLVNCNNDNLYEIIYLFYSINITFQS